MSCVTPIINLKSFEIATALILVLMTGCTKKSSDHAHHEMQKTANHEIPNHDTDITEAYLSDIVKSANEVVISNQATIKPGIIKTGRTISADGYISLDERRNNMVSARFAGRIEKLFIKYNYQYVKKGEKIMELYSPEINTILGEFIHHLNSQSDKSLIQKTKEKLRLLGLTEDEIASTELSGQAPERIPVFSLNEGFVFFEPGTYQSGPSLIEVPGRMKMGKESGQGKSPGQASPSIIKEGAYVYKGQTLFITNDIKEVWALASFSAKDEVHVKINSPVTVLSDLAGSSTKGIINFIEPEYNEGQKFTQVRIYLKNEKRSFKIHSTLTIQIFSEGNLFSIPQSSILDLGKRRIVWAKIGLTQMGNKLFGAKKVITGNEINGFTEIISGINENDEIARDAAYMVDSESFIKINQ